MGCAHGLGAIVRLGTWLEHLTWQLRALIDWDATAIPSMRFVASPQLVLIKEDCDDPGPDGFSGQSRHWRRAGGRDEQGERRVRRLYGEGGRRAPQVAGAERSLRPLRYRHLRGRGRKPGRMAKGQGRHVPD